MPSSDPGGAEPRGARSFAFPTSPVLADVPIIFVSIGHRVQDVVTRALAAANPAEQVARRQEGMAWHGHVGMLGSTPRIEHVSGH